MAKASSKTREAARKLYLTGELSTNAEIAAHLKLKAHTIGQWRRQEDWDGLRRKIDRRAAELLVEKIASDRSALNAQHFQLWGLVVSQLLSALKSGNPEKVIRHLEKAAGILERAQKGQRLARMLVDDVVGGGLAMEEAQPHVVLLGLVAREHHHAIGAAEAAIEQSAHDTLSEGARAPRHQNPLVVYRQRCVLAS
jgi:hypothetical protein